MFTSNSVYINFLISIVATDDGSQNRPYTNDLCHIMGLSKHIKASLKMVLFVFFVLQLISNFLPSEHYTDKHIFRMTQSVNLKSVSQPF